MINKRAVVIGQQSSLMVSENCHTNIAISSNCKRTFFL